MSSEHDIGELCNGSTYDSDSYCLGSNPSSPAIRLHGQAVKTLPSQGKIRGSIPLGGAKATASAVAFFVMRICFSESDAAQAVLYPDSYPGRLPVNPGACFFAFLYHHTRFFSLANPALYAPIPLHFHYVLSLFFSIFEQFFPEYLGTMAYRVGTFVYFC